MTTQKARPGCRVVNIIAWLKHRGHYCFVTVCETSSNVLLNIFIENLKMADNDVDVNEELLDYEDEPETEVADGENAADAGAARNGKVKGNYVSIHSSGFRDFLLKPEVLRSIGDCGFEHPSEVQHECIPQVNINDCYCYDELCRGMETRRTCFLAPVSDVRGHPR